MTATNIVANAVLGGLLAASTAGIGAALEGRSPSEIEQATGNPFNIVVGMLAGIAGGYLGAFRLGRFILTAVALGAGGWQAQKEYRSGNNRAAIYYAMLAIGASVLINVVPYLQGTRPPTGTLVVGGGSAPGFPAQPEGNLTLNIDPSAQPNVLGSISNPPFANGSFGQVYYENVPYTAFTGSNGGAIQATSDLLPVGGRIVIDTGSKVPVSEVQGLLQEAGFANIQVSTSPTGGVRITAIKGGP